MAIDSWFGTTFTHRERIAGPAFCGKQLLTAMLDHDESCKTGT